MTANYLRQNLRPGRDYVVATDREVLPLATVVEHSRDGVYLGIHPDLLFVRYDEIREILR